MTGDEAAASGSSAGWLAGTDEQAKTVAAVSAFGTTVVTEVGDLARYTGRVLGTVPEDAVGLVLGDPLRLVRTVLAAQYDDWITRILARRGVKKTAPVSPSLALPLLRGAYDESRLELQELWAALIAAAMDPARSGRVRLSFIDALKKFDPLDALVLKTRAEHLGDLKPSAGDFVARMIPTSREEVLLSADNLATLKCAYIPAIGTQNFGITLYGQALLRACSD